MKNSWKKLWGACASLVIVLNGGSRAAFADSSLESYVSEVDGSTQHYGLYLPEPFAPEVSHPVVFHLHGYGGTASADFPTTRHRPDIADARGWILVDLDGRGATYYDGVGETHFFDALDDLRARYKIDEDRIYLAGCSMGGMGAFKLGFRHPNLFAAVAGVDGEWDHFWGTAIFFEKVWEMDVPKNPSREPLLQGAYPLYLAENEMHLNLYMMVNANDSQVNPEYNGRRLHARLNELGYAHSYNEYGGEHCDGYDVPAIYDFFSERVNDPSPKDVILKANQLKYGSAYWVPIDRLEKSVQFATIEAAMSNDRVDVTASGLLQYTLFLTPELVGKDEVSIYTNGEPSYTGPVGEIALYASINEFGAIAGWSTDESLPRGLRKTAQVEGIVWPIQETTAAMPMPIAQPAVYIRIRSD